MPTRRTVPVSLSPEMQAVAGRLRDTGRHGDIGDVTRAAPRLPGEREPDVRVRRDVRLAAAEQEAARA